LLQRTQSPRRTPTLSKAVTERALVQRINRVLPKRDTPPDIRGLVLKIGRTGRSYYLAKGRSTVVGNVDIDALARRLSVLKPYEHLPGVIPAVPAGHPKPDPLSGAAWPHNVGAIRGYAVRAPSKAHVIRKPKTRIQIRMGPGVGPFYGRVVDYDHIRDKVSGKRKR
jgi:hypothetical protein